MAKVGDTSFDESEVRTSYFQDSCFRFFFFFFLWGIFIRSYHNLTYLLKLSICIATQIQMGENSITIFLRQIFVVFMQNHIGKI